MFPCEIKSPDQGYTQERIEGFARETQIRSGANGHSRHWCCSKEENRPSLPKSVATRAAVQERRLVDAATGTTRDTIPASVQPLLQSYTVQSKQLGFKANHIKADAASSARIQLQYWFPDPNRPPSPNRNGVKSFASAPSCGSKTIDRRPNERRILGSPNLATHLPKPSPAFLRSRPRPVLTHQFFDPP